MEKLYCGIDIHKEKLAGCIMHKDGKIMRKHIFPFTRQGIRDTKLDNVLYQEGCQKTFEFKNTLTKP